MKKTPICLLCLLSWGTGASMAQSKCGSLPDGEIIGRTYTNKELGLSYTFPASLAKDSSSNLPKDKNGNGRLLLVLWKTPRDFDKPSVIAMTDDPSKYADRTAVGYLHRIENTVKKYSSAKIIASGQVYELSGIKFYRVDYQFQEPTAVFNTAITGQVGGCELTFQFVARTSQEIETFVESINTVRIASQKP